MRLVFQAVVVFRLPLRLNHDRWTVGRSHLMAAIQRAIELGQFASRYVDVTDAFESASDPTALAHRTGVSTFFQKLLLLPAFDPDFLLTRYFSSLKLLSKQDT